MNTKALLQENYLDILYNGKNKKYGSYELRSNYAKRMLIGSLLSLLFLSSIFVSALFKKETIEIQPLVNDGPIEIKDVTIIPKEKLIPEEVPPVHKVTRSKPKSTYKYTPPVIKKNEEVTATDKITDINERKENSVAGNEVNTIPDSGLEDLGLSKENGNGFKPGNDIIDVEKKKEVHRQVDRKATAPVTIENFLKENVIYPEMMRAEGKSGIVIVEFVVKQDGSMENVKVLKSPDPIFTKEAMRVVKLLQSIGKWTPAMKNGNPVNSYFSIPFKFQFS